MCNQKAALLTYTNQLQTKCPVHPDSTLRRDKEGKIYCPVGGQSCIEEAITRFSMEMPNPLLERVPGSRYKRVAKVR